MRKALTTILIALVITTLVLAGGSGTWAQKGPIKVGLFVPQSGPLAANGKDMVNGLQLFFEEQSYRLAGREIKLINASGARTSCARDGRAPSPPIPSASGSTTT